MKGIVYSYDAYYSNYSYYSKMEMSLDSYLGFKVSKDFSRQWSRLVPHLELMPIELPSLEVVRGTPLYHGSVHRASTLLPYQAGTPSEGVSSYI